MEEHIPVGTTKGPGETQHEYTFVSADPEQQLTYGEFVYYTAEVDGVPRPILGRISGREALRQYPDDMLADPSVSPSELARILGYEGQSDALYEIAVTILGYHSRGLGFVNPRIPPRPGRPIYVAPDEMLAGVLGRVRPGATGAVEIGWLLTRPKGDVPIVLDAKGFTSTHLAIIASTGSGKSYLASVMIEELLKPVNRAAVLIVDPHGEYGTLEEMQQQSAFSDDGYSPEVRIIRPSGIKVRVSSLTAGDLAYLLPNMTERMHYVLGQAVRQVNRSKSGTYWTRDDLMIAVRSGGGRPDPPPEMDDRLDEDPTVGALLWRLNSILMQSSIFDDYQSLPLEDLFRPGQCTVLQLNDVPEREQRIVVATILRRLYRSRVETARGSARPGDEGYLPYPAFVLIEEAHNYAPASGDVVTTSVLKQILAEGRKFGVAVGLITQRPGRLDADVLSQCMTQCIMRIVNPIDQARIAESVETVGRDLLNELPALSRGQAIVAGASIETPVMIQVRPRLTPHGAEDPDAPALWHAYFQEERARQRERDQAPPSGAGRSRGQSRMGGAGLPF